jgi:ParB/RepB/Spo0J family partition protein
MKKHLEEISPAALEPSPWNPRAATDLDPENAEMQKLIASIRSSGIHQSLAVWRTDPGDLVVIAGHRRHAAALAAGLETVPCIVYEDIDETEARSITRIENEIRLGISPQEDARLLSSMVAAGWKQNELAARFGVSPATICRRMKLTNLSPKINAAIATSKAQFTVDALEYMGAYPVEVQDKILVSLRNLLKGKDVVMRGDVMWYFLKETCDLERAVFSAKEICAACPNRTGAERDLFDDVGENCLGRCLNPKCFAAKMREADIAELKKIADGAEIVDGKELPFTNFWNAKSRDDIFSLTKKRTSKFNTLYYWTRSDERSEYLWGLPLKKIEKKLHKEKVEAAAAAEKCSRLDALMDAVYSARDAILNKYDEADIDVEQLIQRHVICDETPCGAILAQAIVLGIEDWEFGDRKKLEFLRMFPAFAEFFEITPEMFAAFDKAQEAYDKAKE